MDKNNLKEQFRQQCFDAENEDTYDFSVLVTLVKLPTGAIETIVNTSNLSSKIHYLYDNYDAEFKLKANPEVQIVGYTVY